LHNADGRTLACEPVPDFLMDMVDAGGLLRLLRQRMAAKKEADAR
jgi:3-isopropylmalate/(R)-2-methylmalate dehydratase small subunit